MKDNEIVGKLVSYGKTIKVICIVVAILMVFGGLILANSVEEAAGTIIFMYLIYAAALIAAGFINELVFNWMAAVLRNLKK